MARTFEEPAPLNLNGENVWIAAAVAHRLNGGYLKEDRYDYETDTTQHSNRALMKGILVNHWANSKPEYAALPEDVEVAALARAHYANQLVLLLNDSTSGFLRSAIAAASAERINTNMEIRLIAALIKTYHDDTKLFNLNTFKESLGSVHYGAIKEKICFANPEVLECRFVQSIGAWSVEAVAKSNLFKWWSTDKVELGQHREMAGRVKRHESDYRTGVPATALNYVKLK